MTDQSFLEAWDKEMADINTDKQKLYEQMLAKFKESGEKNVEYCWRLVQVKIAMADAAEKAKKKSEAKKHIEESYEFAKKCIELDPKSLQAQIWFCASIGRMSSLVGNKERLHMGNTFKEHRDIVMEMAPEDPLIHHMYARWCSEVAGLGYIERKLAETFFGSVPQATNEDWLQSVLKAESLRPDWKMNRLWIAKAYIAQKNYEQAIQWIDKAVNLPIKTEEDAINQVELESLEKSYAKYRPKK